MRKPIKQNRSLRLGLGYEMWFTTELMMLFENFCDSKMISKRIDTNFWIKKMQTSASKDADFSFKRCKLLPQKMQTSASKDAKTLPQKSVNSQ